MYQSSQHCPYMCAHHAVRVRHTCARAKFADPYACVRACVATCKHSIQQYLLRLVPHASHALWHEMKVCIWMSTMPNRCIHSSRHERRYGAHARASPHTHVMYTPHLIEASNTAFGEESEVTFTISGVKWLGSLRVRFACNRWSS